jgi:hypothetical protein
MILSFQKIQKLSLFKLLLDLPPVGAAVFHVASSRRVARHAPCLAKAVALAQEVDEISEESFHGATP